MLSVQEMLDLICWDRRYVVVPDDVLSPEHGRSVFLLDPRSVDRMAALQAKRVTEMSCEQQEVPTEKELFQIYKDAGIWTAQDDLVRKEAQNHISFLEKKIKDENVLVRRRSYEKQLKDTREQAYETEAKYNTIYVNTREYLLRETELMTLVSRLVLRVDNGEPLWPTEHAFLEDRERFGQYIIFLMHRVAEEIDLSTTEYRRLARAGEWRLIWTLSRENLAELFSRPIQDLSSRQKLLIYWSRVYDSVYDDYERPDDEIVQDDDKLDEWLANRSIKQDEKRAESKLGSKPDRLSGHNERIQFLDGYHIDECTCGALKSRGKGLGESKVHDAGCKWGTWRAYTEEEKASLADQFYGRNTKQVRNTLNREQSRVAREGVIEENVLRDKKTRMVYGQQSKIFNKGMKR